MRSAGRCRSGAGSRTGRSWPRRRRPPGSRSTRPCARRFAAGRGRRTSSSASPATRPCHRRRRCGRRRASPTAPARRWPHARGSSPAARRPPGTPGSGPGPGFAIVGGPHPGHSRSSASRSDHTGAWSPCGAAPTPRRPARPRRTPRPPRRPSPTRAAQPITLQNARRFPHPRFQLSDSRNRRRGTACGASGPLRRPRKGHKSPILKSEGLERLERRGPAGPAPRLEPVTAKALGAWPTGARHDCDHAGLYLLLPAMVELGLDQLIGAASYPGTKVLSSFHSMASLLMLKCSRRGRAGNAFPLGADPGLGLALGLLALPKATHLTSYSYRVRRASNLALLEGLGRQCRQVGLYNGQGGFNLDFHTIRHHGEQVPLEEHYVVSRSQRIRSVLTFFAQDHASTEMVYANADITKAEQAGEVIAFAEYWKRVAGADPGLLVFDSKLTTYPVLDELAARGITFLTLRQRGPKVLEALAALPASAWRTHNVK